MAQDYDDDYYDDDEFYDDEMDDDSLSSALSAQMGAAPWYVSSVAVHCVIFLIMLLFFSREVKQQKTNIVEIVTDIVEPEPEKKEEEPEPDIKENDPKIETEDEVVIETPVVKTTEVEISAEFETDDEMDTNSALGDPDNVSDIDHEFVGTPALMGVGASGGTGGGGKFGTRFGGGRRNAIRAGGGGKRTESAVNWALKWLAAHQESDGRWDCAEYGGGGHGGDDVAVTSLAVLAFLGAGNSTKFGRYRRNVSKAVEWLMTQQNESGHAGPHRYTGGIYTMALAEAFGMSEDPEIGRAAQRAVDWACKSQCATGAWDYQPKSTRSDTSVSGWWIMGLKSAKVAGLSIPSEVMNAARKYIEAATSPTGQVGYAYKDVTSVAQVKPEKGSIRMTAVSLTCLQFLGAPRTDARVVGCANKSVANLPQANKFDFYEWYYQALGLFQMGVTSNYWQSFNEPMKRSLVTTQVKVGTVEQNKGSWNPESDEYGNGWGRVGQTAIGALMLEIYYRYEEIHK